MHNLEKLSRRPAAVSLPSRSYYEGVRHSLCYDNLGADVYGGYKESILVPSAHGRTNDSFVVSILGDAADRLNQSAKENQESLIPTNVSKVGSLWRVGGLCTQTTGHYKMSSMWYRSYFALAILGALQGLTTWVISLAVGVAWKLQDDIVGDMTLSLAERIFFVGGIKSGFILSSVIITWTFAPSATGSGIPELRAILGGLHIKKYFAVRTLIVKIIGLTLALCSGLPLGLEGPFIHFSACIARQFTRIKLFKDIDRKQLLVAVCAGGLSACFSSPIGGLLFSIEVTLTYFEVTSYWTTFCCAAVSSCVTSILQPAFLFPYKTAFDNESWTKSEIPFFIIVGLLGGILGTIIIRFHEGVVHIRRKYQRKLCGSNPFIIAIFVVGLFTFSCFTIAEIMNHPARNSIPALFDDSTSTLKTDVLWGAKPGMYANLLIFMVFNSVFIALTNGLSIPCGVFAPVFIVGAAYGRLMGEFFQEVTLNSSFLAVESPAVYSVIGAAALASGFTKTISPAVIAMELTNDVQLAMPILLTVTIACGVNSQLLYSFYDSILYLKNIPLLPFAPSEPEDKSCNPPRPVEAADVMSDEFWYVKTDPNPEEVAEILDNTRSEFYPIVHSKQDMVLVGEVRRETLRDYLRNRDHEFARGTLISNHQLPLDDETDPDVLHHKSLLNERFMNRVNRSPIQVVCEMSLTTIYAIFHVLRPHNIYVTKYGRLIGVVYERDLLARELEIQLGKRSVCRRFCRLIHRLSCFKKRSGLSY